MKFDSLNDEEIQKVLYQNNSKVIPRRFQRFEVVEFVILSLNIHS